MDLYTKQPHKKLVLDYKELNDKVKALRKLGYEKIAVTIGSWDLLHIGHLRFLTAARGYGDALIVGVDSDRGIKSYKGPLRPVVPEVERCEMLTYQTPVDLITLIDDINPQGEWGYDLIKLIKPDVFVAVEDSYPDKQLAEIKKYVKQLEVLPRQAESTSTTQFVQNTVKRHLDAIYNQVLGS